MHGIWTDKAEMKSNYGKIDSAINALVNRMNTIDGVYTVASCHGHACGWKPPYVYFKAPVSVAASIEKRLRETMDCGETLHAHWCIYGMFDSDYAQTFLLHAPEYHQRAKSLLQSIWLFGIRRKRMNAELAMLSNCMEQAMLSSIRSITEPKIVDRRDRDTDSKNES